MKNFKKLFFWLKYKRVPEKKWNSCKGCIFNDYGYCLEEKNKLADKCYETRTIFARRSFKLFTLLAVILLFSSCSMYINCNINRNKLNPIHKEFTPIDTTEGSRWLFQY